MPKTNDNGITTMKHTPLHDQHVALGAKMVDFGGWDMPLAYGSQIEEHHQVRRDAGMFDVSHMTVVDITGPQARDYLRRLLANDVDRLAAPGKALYSCMLDEQGGVIDDLIVYHLDANRYRMVINAATTDKDLAWMRRQAEGFDVDLKVRDDLAMIAVQGPTARERVHRVLGGEAERVADLKPFFMAELGEMAVARTGYTGEDGYEIMLPAGAAADFWQRLLDAGVKPCGLGARDTLRLEAGMNLYGSDMDETVTPLESGLAWTVAFEPADRDFIGRAALERQRAEGVGRKLVGLVLEDRGVLRNHQPVLVNGAVAGEITSGSFSPTLGRAIALARVPADTGDSVAIEMRGKTLHARVVKPPFVRHGKALV